jgi:hypothetical protein
MPIEKLQALGRAIGGSNLQEKVIRNSKAVVEDTQASGNNLVGTQGMIILYSSLDFRKAQL